MAELTDEERAKAVLGEVEGADPVDPAKDPAAPTDPEDKPEVEDPDEIAEDPEKPEDPAAEPGEPAGSSFTKQFPNLKGDTLEDYTPELEKAYDNSFKEALRLNQLIKDNETLVAQARAIVAAGTPPPTADPTNPPAAAAPPVQQSPSTLLPADQAALDYAKDAQRRDMFAAFDTFKKDYPQATEAQAFEAFQKASDGVSVALTNSLGRKPTYEELFPAIAGTLGWKPTKASAARDAAILSSGAAPRSGGGQAPVPPKPAKVSDASIAAYQKMFTSKTREEAIKDLSEVA